MVYKQSLQEWIDSFQTADIHTIDRQHYRLLKTGDSQKRMDKGELSYSRKLH